MKQPNQQDPRHAMPTANLEPRPLRDDQLRACTGGNWDIPAGTASPSS